MTSRRVFVKNGAFALVSLGFAPSFLARTALAAGATARARRLIAIKRPGAANDAAVDLDGFFGFNPRLEPLKPFWDARQLAIVHACGSPDNTRSHFDAQDDMETATPGV